MVLSMVLASCAPAVTEEGVTPEEEKVAVEKPKYGSKLVLALPYGAQRFDPAFGHHYLAPSLYLTNEDLVAGDWAKGKAGTGEDDWMYYSKITSPQWAGGQIAESWEFVGEDTIIYHIRKGVHFHNKPPTNGREVDAYDVEYSLLRLWEYMGSFHITNSPWDDCFESIKATDKWTLEVKYKNRSDAWALVGDMTDIFPRDALEEFGDMQKWENSIGTGPFMLVDHVADSSLTFERFDNYWMKDPIGPGKGNQLPYVDSVKILVITDASTRMSALRTGKIDQLQLTWEDAESIIETNPQIKYYWYVGDTAPGLHFKVDNPDLPSYNKKVRQALMMGLNQQSIVDFYYDGKAKLLSWPATPAPFLKDVYVPLEQQPAIVKEMFGYNPDKAKQMLAEAGYPNGFKIEIACSAAEADLLSIVKADWEKIGVDLKLDVREYAALVSLGTARQHKDMYYRAVPCTLPKDLDVLMPGNWLNFGNVDDLHVWDQVKSKTGMDSLMFLNEAEANRMGKELIKYVLEQAYIIALPVPDLYNFWQPWVKNYHGEMSVGLADLFTWTKYAWIDQDLLKEMTGAAR